MTTPTLIDQLRGNALNCECSARAWGECCCDTYWPESACNEAADRITELEAELAEWEKLKDPINLHVNLLRGVPCQLDRMQHLLHLAGATDYDDLKAANDKMRKCLEAIAEHHDELSIYPTMPDGEPAQDQYHTERRDFAREGLK